MQIRVHFEVRGRKIAVTESLRERTTRHLQFSLSRFGDRIGRVTVRLTDASGDGTGDDKSCRVEVQLCPPGSVVVEDVESDLDAAIDRATERAGRAVSRELAISRLFEDSATSPHEKRTRR